MAGIGFRLQKLLSGDSYSSSLKAYAYSSMIAAGPFLLTVLVVTGLHQMTLDRLTILELSYLKTLITYGFAFSLISVGMSYLVITRSSADDLYRGHSTHFTAAYFSSVLLHALVFGPLVLLFTIRLSASWMMKLNFLNLYVAVTGTWLALIFLSAARNYNRMIWAFVSGAIVSLAAAFLLGHYRGIDGYFSGFVIGQLLTFFILSHAIIEEFGYRQPQSFQWLGYFQRYPRLAAIGFFYNLGIWVDKFVFWSSSYGEALDTGLRHCPVYDAPLFFAYLSIVPSLAYFLVQMETDFFFRYQAYYQSIQNQESFPSLEKRRLAILKSLGYNLKRLLLYQGMISGLCLLATPWLAQVFKMDTAQMGILRIGLFASFLQAGFLICLNLILYFDFQKEALVSCAVFFISNLVFSWLSIHFGLAAFGYGYTLACLLALTMTLYYLNERLTDLHFWTFMRQPLPRPVVIYDED